MKAGKVVSFTVENRERMSFHGHSTGRVEVLELGSELSRPVRKVSLGQRMMAELIAALLHRHEVQVLDEPTLGLDVNARPANDFLFDD